VASELKITKAALHYHFASKSELGEALVTRYATRFAEALAATESQFEDAPSQLEAYVGLYLSVLRKKRMCLCGMLSADYRTLPGPMQDAVLR
jgi:TetR/AcrR family transcriptional repressor of nem operon